MKNLALAVLETLAEEFGILFLKDLHLSASNRIKVQAFLKEEGEGFQLEGNGFGAFLEEGEDIHYISFVADVPDYLLLNRYEEYPVLYTGTDIVNYNRIVYVSESGGFWANYDHNREFYFDFNVYPEIVEEWTTK